MRSGLILAMQALIPEQTVAGKILQEPYKHGKGIITKSIYVY